MTMTRMFRRFVCRLMLGVLVFGQLAIAAYACPALSGMPQSLPTMALNASAAAMPGDEAGAAMAVSPDMVDRKSTRLNSSHLVISYAVFCLKKKNKLKRVNTAES